MDLHRFAVLRDIYKTALLDDVVSFWQRHSVDRECGGFFMYLDRDGSVYGTDKPVWLQGRATWLYATLYDRVEPREEWLTLARHGYDFLIKHCFERREAPGPGKMYFSVARDGRPLQMRRYVFSEVFGVLGFAALAKATGEARVCRQAIDLFESFVRDIRTPSRIAPKIDPQTRPMKSLSPLMCLLNMADTMLPIADQTSTANGPGSVAYYEQLIDQTVAEIFRDHVRSDDECVLETVAPDGQRIDEPIGRVMSPGHAIEVAWFIMEVAQRRGDAELAERAARIVDWSFARGWDAEYGGLLYFVDVTGRPGPHLEHDMKLWWPHSEALYATMLAHRLTGDDRYAAMHEQVHGWTFAHLPDAEFGEWFGYLRRDGAVSSPLKGNMWKGPFHVPRALLYCWKLAEGQTSRS